MHYIGLAEQSVYAALEIEQTADRVQASNMQNLNDTLVITYPSSANLSKVDPQKFKIVNLPHMIKTLPQNSIFDYILYIDPNSPDLRFVIVAGETSSKNGPYPISGNLGSFFRTQPREMQNTEPLMRNIAMPKDK